MEYAELREILKSYISDIRNQKHVDNSYVSFDAQYYAVKSNNEVIESPSDSILKDFEWAVIVVRYCSGQNYRGYYDGAHVTKFVTQEGIITSKLKFDDLELRSDFCIYSLDQQILYNPDMEFRGFTPVEDKLSRVCQLLPILHGCRTLEQAEMIISIRRNKKDNCNREDIVDSLMGEINRQKSIIADYEKKFEEIREILSSKIPDDSSEVDD